MTDRTAGLTWADLLEQLVAEHGTLTQVAWKLVEQSKVELDVTSVERALRRLRNRGQRDGGAWGQRLARVFGMPKSVEDRVRWLGCYHSPFNDLPVALCLDQLRLWDRPPMAGSRARLWVHLGFVTCALRTRRLDDAALHAARVREALAGLDPSYDVARIELALVDGFVASRTAQSSDDASRAGAAIETDDPNRAGARSAAVDACLDRATQLLASATLDGGDRACFAARLADQRAYQLNRAGDHAAALAIYQALPVEDSHPFASYRRDSGLAYGLHKLGRTDEALALARRAIQHAGDGGYTRLRVMGLLMLARIAGRDSEAGVDALGRARSIATRLGDDELLERAAKI